MAINFELDGQPAAFRTSRRPRGRSETAYFDKVRALAQRFGPLAGTAGMTGIG